MVTVPAQIFCAPARAKLIAAARSIPGVCGVLRSSWSAGMTLTPSVRQSRVLLDSVIVSSRPCAKHSRGAWKSLLRDRYRSQRALARAILPRHTIRRGFMATIKSNDGTEIYYKDWGTGKPVVFSHGWPLSADAFEDQMFFLASHGYRCIAHDRRGHGRSSQPWKGNDLDTYADDLAKLIETLNLREATLVGHSTGGGEVARYIGRHGTMRVAKAVLIGAIPPLMLKTEANPGGLSIE